MTGSFKSKRCSLCRSLGLIAFIAASATGCLEPLPSPSLVDDLRVLGLRAEPPELAPGAETMLDALVFDPEGRPLTHAWYICLVAERGQGFFGGGGQTSSSGGGGTPLQTDPDGGSCRTKFERGRPWAWSLGFEPTATFTVPDDLLDSDEALAIAFGLPADLEIPPLIRLGFLGIAGLNLTVQHFVSNGERELESFRRLNVSVASPVPNNARNRNPTGLALHLAEESPELEPPSTGNPWAEGRCFTDEGPALRTGVEYRLSPLNFPDEPAPYVVLLAGSTTGEPFEIQETTETYFYSFFATAGDLTKTISKQPGKPSNTWLFEEEPEGDVDFWVVVRDGRGGTAWCHDRVQVR